MKEDNIIRVIRGEMVINGGIYDIINPPKAFLQGFNALSWQYDEDRKMALTTSSQEFTQIKALTKEIGIDVLFGYNEL